MLVSFFAMDISDFSYFIVIKLLKISDLSKFLTGYLMLKILNNDKFTTAQNRHFLARQFFSLYPLILYGLQLNAVAISKRDSFSLLTIK